MIMKPRVLFLTLGGTISTVSSASGLVPAAGGEALLAMAPGLGDFADIRVENLSLLASASLDLDMLLTLRHRIGAAHDVDGVVITMGTDALEEVAFGLDLLLLQGKPVVVTGAMRAPALPGSDFASNILNAVRVAISLKARGLGVLVVMNEEAHAACHVTKTHTSTLGAFASPGLGPVAVVTEGEVRLRFRPQQRAGELIDIKEKFPPVALIKAALGDDGRLLDQVADLGYQGLVIEAMGGGHVRAEWVARLAALAARLPVVYASRTGAGAVLRDTYGYPGSERDLLAAGLIPVGFLSGLKARLLLMVGLMAGDDRAMIAHRFAQFQ